MIITIDGPAAAGKGTLAQTLSQLYSLAYFDTGMLYRAVGLDMILNNQDVNNEEIAEKFAKALTFTKMHKLSGHKDFRSDIGGRAASVVSVHPKVRASLLKMQQDFAKHPIFADGTPAKGAIYDGRDTGTVVCPNADIKLFVTASAEVRANRRYKEFQEKGLKTTLHQVLEDMKSRDLRDSQRVTAPLKPADDAIIIDTSNLKIEDVIDLARKIIDSKQ